MFKWWGAIVGKLCHIKVLELDLREKDGKEYVKIEFLDGFAKGEIVSFCVPTQHRFQGDR